MTRERMASLMELGLESLFWRLETGQPAQQNLVPSSEEACVLSHGKGLLRTRVSRGAVILREVSLKVSDDTLP